jgi:hypothetical protein
MVAMRYRNDSKHYPATLYYSTTSGIKLDRDSSTGPTEERDEFTIAEEQKALEAFGPHLIVSSEPTSLSFFATIKSDPGG